MNIDRSDLIPVEGNNNLYRDRRTGAILNMNKNAYSNYIKSRNKQEKEKNEINQMKQDIEEIKSLLKEIINGSK